MCAPLEGPVPHREGRKPVIAKVVSMAALASQTGNDKEADVIESMTHALVVHQMRTENCFAYLIADADTRGAALVNPRADRVADYLRELEERELRLRLVIETIRMPTTCRARRNSEHAPGRGAALGAGDVRGRDAPASRSRPRDARRPQDRGPCEPGTYGRFHEPARGQSGPHWRATHQRRWPHRFPERQPRGSLAPQDLQRVVSLSDEKTGGATT
jgi:hypothetical protein